MLATKDESRKVEVRELARHDLVGLARCMALDADTFPHPSIPSGLPPGWQTLVALAGTPSHAVGFVTSTATPAMRYVHGLAVASSARRQGTGRALVRACIDAAGAAGVRFIVLHVGVANTPAVALYAGEGFEVRRVMRDFYGPGLYASPHAYEMALTLPRRTAGPPMAVPLPNRPFPSSPAPLRGP